MLVVWPFLATISYSGFFPVDDAPVYSDHDFPFADSKIIPSGYFVLQHHGRSRQACSRSLSPCRTGAYLGSITRSRSLSPHRAADSSTSHRSTDKLGRCHYVTPSTGPLHVFNRASNFFKATSSEHISDIDSLLQSDPSLKHSILSLIIDGGPDFSPKHLMNIMTYGQLWKDHDLDGLMVTCHAAGNSAFNKIEHAWSPPSKSLAGVTLPNALPGEVPPEQQRELSEEERKSKLAAVFDSAIDELCSYWSRLTVDGFPVSASKVACVNSSLKYSDSHRQSLEEFLSASMKHIKENEGLVKMQKFLLFLCDHLNRSTYHLCFLKCAEDECSHCMNSPVQATDAVQFLRSFGGRICTPVFSQQYPEHYRTFMESNLARQLGQSPPLADEALPSGVLGRCDFNCSYVYLSARDKERHERMVHEGQVRVRKRKKRQEKGAANGSANKTTCHRCTYLGCDRAFTSAYQLNQHKQEAGHMLARGRPAKH